MLRDGVMIVDRIDVWRLFRVVVTCCMVDSEKSGSGSWRYDERGKKRRDGDAMRKRNHVIPVRLKRKGTQGTEWNRWKKKRTEPGRVYAFVDFRSTGTCKTL